MGIVTDAVVRQRRVELLHPYGHQGLNLACLPISTTDANPHLPHRHRQDGGMTGKEETGNVKGIEPFGQAPGGVCQTQSLSNYVPGGTATETRTPFIGVKTRRLNP